MIGASEGETLGDVLAVPGANEARCATCSIALERGAFTYDDDLTHAIDDACGALERYVAVAIRERDDPAQRATRRAGQDDRRTRER